MHRTRHPLGLAVAAFWLCHAQAASATMGSETILSRVDADKNKALSLPEVRAAAGRRYDLIRSRNGGRVTMLRLGGRLVPADLKEIGKQIPGVSSTISKDDYLALAAKFFDKADIHRKSGDAPGSGSLGVGELQSPAGKKLIGLLE